MPESSEMCRCAQCGNEFPRPHSYGMRPRYCSPAHRQRAYLARHGFRPGAEIDQPGSVSSPQRVSKKILDSRGR